MQQVERRSVGLRSVEVKRGRLYLNNREIKLAGASIHEDMPGSGAALSAADMDRIVADLKELGANVTRAHYVLNDRLLVAPGSRRHHGLEPGADLAARPPGERAARGAAAQARLRDGAAHGGGRPQPPVGDHALGGQRAVVAARRPPRRDPALPGERAPRFARELDPTLPISVDINGRPYHPEQFTYHDFDMLGINQYFGWYSWVSNFDDLPLYLQEMRDLYPQLALVMTEFGAEARPELASAPADKKGSYAFQTFHLERTLDVADAAPISGSIYWTVREFEIFPGWTGGAGRRPPPYQPNTRHQKGLLTYEGERKPAWYVARDRFRATQLYR